MKIKIQLFTYALFIVQPSMAMAQEDVMDFTRDLPSIPLKMTYTKITEDYYQAYSPNGVILDLPHIITSISIFSKNADGRYVFIKNDEYSLPHGTGTIDNAEQTKNTVLTKSTPAAICIAFEMVTAEYMMGGSIRPRKRISKLDRFIFDFGKNISPEEINLHITRQHQQKIDITMSFQIDQETNYILPIRCIDEQNILSNNNAPIIYELSSKKTNGYMNTYWESILNS